MRKIRLLSLIVAAEMLFTGCSKSNNEQTGNGARIVWTFGSADERGELFTDGNMRLHFVDFENMNTALVCSKPNCTHTNEKECSSFGMSNHPILHGDKLYFFDVETNFDGDEITDTTTIYKAETDGTNRTRVCTVEGLALLDYTRMLIVGDKAYFSMDKTGWNDEHTATSGYNEVWFCGFDFSTETFERIEMLREGWCSSSWIFGLFNGKVIFSYAYSEEKVPYLEDHSEIEKYFINVFKTYDTESGEIAELTLPEPLCVSGGYYVYEKDGGTVVLSENGEELFLPGFAGSTIENGMLFGRETCADLSKGKIYALNNSDGIVAYSDGYYILKSLDSYSKIAEADYIGDAL